MKNILGFIAVGLLLVVSCDTASQEPQPPADNGGVPINISINPVDDVDYENGDKAGVFVSKTPSASQIFVNNSCFVYQDDKWSSSEKLVWDSESVTSYVSCYIPYAKVDSPSEYIFDVPTDQSSYSSYKASDLLCGFRNSVRTTSEPVSISMKHVLSRVVVTLECGEGFSEEELAGADVWVYSWCTQAKVNLLTCLVSVHKYELSEVKSYYNSTEKRFYAVVVPNYVNDDRDFIKVRTMGGAEYLIKSAKLDMVSGKQYEFNVTLDKSGCGLNVGVTDWTVDDTDYGGNVY